MKLMSILVMLAAIPLCSFAQTKLPADVARFVERRDQCDHFRGEDAYDAARKKFIEKSVQTFCAGTDKRLARLKVRYWGKPEVMDRLNSYEPRIEN